MNNQLCPRRSRQLQSVAVEARRVAEKKIFDDVGGTKFEAPIVDRLEKFEGVLRFANI
jgi:hypothetical protein